MSRTSAVSPEQFATFGDLLKYLRRRVGLTQRELSIAAGYSDTQISRMEQNRRPPDAATLAARFIPALHLDDEPEWVKRLLELATASRAESIPEGQGADASTPPHNLPIQQTSFIGRRKEISEVKRLFSKTRLLTLTGSGGTGKTRLSQQVATDLLPSFADGVWFIELAPLADPALVSQTVATTLGLRVEGNRPVLNALTESLREKTILLILDNCEHVIDSCARLAEALLSTCPNLRILASSREALGIPGETAFRVPSLSLPNAHEAMPSETLVEYEAVRLFVERATAVMPNFRVTNDNAPAVAEVCQRLDGIPLAIELAAARASVLRVEQIAARLSDRFRLLTGGSRTALPRQQTLRATMDWSYNLLSEIDMTPDEQTVYDQQLKALREQVDSDSFTTAWAEGQAMTLEQAIAYALEKTDV